MSSRCDKITAFRNSLQLSAQAYKGLSKFIILHNCDYLHKPTQNYPSSSSCTTVIICTSLHRTNTVHLLAWREDRWTGDLIPNQIALEILCLVEDEDSYYFKVEHLIGWPCFTEWPHAHNYMKITIWTRKIIFKKMMIWSWDVFERLRADLREVRGRTGDENDQNVSWNFQIIDKHITIKGNDISIHIL